MKYFSETEGYISGECENCKRVLKIKSSYADRSTGGYNLNATVTCPCGTVHTRIDGISKAVIAQTNEVKCPKCKSSQFSANNKGFGLGKAAVGGVLLGPVGLLGGFLGSKKVKVTCLNCGHSWFPGNK